MELHPKEQTDARTWKENTIAKIPANLVPKVTKNNALVCYIATHLRKKTVHD